MSRKSKDTFDSESKEHPKIVLALIPFILLCLLFIVVGVIMIKNDINLRINGVKTHATVEEIKSYYDEEEDTYSYQEVVTFRTEAGDEYSAKLDTKAKRKNTHDEGDIIQIYYDPDNPENATDVKSKKAITGGIFLIGFSLPILLLFLWMAKKLIFEGSLL